MTKGPWVISSALLGLLATSAAQAGLITIDANGYAHGTDVSTAFVGASLAHLTFVSGTGMQSTPVYAADCSDMSNPNSPCSVIGPQSFGWQNAAGVIKSYWNSDASYIINCLKTNYSYCYGVPQHLLQVTFDSATNYAQFTSTHFSDHPYVWALDAAGNKLTVTVSHTYHQVWGPGGGAFGYQTVTVSSATSNIARLVIAGNGGSATVDSITFAAP